jgi:hypothetical protein
LRCRANQPFPLMMTEKSNQDVCDINVVAQMRRLQTRWRWLCCGSSIVKKELGCCLEHEARAMMLSCWGSVRVEGEGGFEKVTCALFMFCPNVFWGKAQCEQG